MRFGLQKNDAQATIGQVGAGGEDAPTKKQIDYATQLGIDVAGHFYSRKELSKLIDDAVKKGGGK